MQSSEVKPRVYRQLSSYLSFLSVAVIDYSEEKQSMEERVIGLPISTAVHKKEKAGTHWQKLGVEVRSILLTGLFFTVGSACFLRQPRTGVHIFNKGWHYPVLNEPSHIND